ncbi:MAG: polysaccharide export protein [Negativicutes bacterium]|nr:polysaccharide export protein [Negativicutes bacterium]
MKKSFTAAVLAVVLLQAALPVYGLQLSREDYVVAPGDVLAISVAGLNSAGGYSNVMTANYGDISDKTLAMGSGSNGIMVRPDGKIEFPLIGEVTVSGLTVVQANALITEKLKVYIRQPRVTVNVVQYHTTRVYVLGQVVKPGLYELSGTHTLLDAIGVAGGYTPNAAKREVFVLNRNRLNEQPKKYNLLALLEKGDMSQNCELQDNDVVYLSDNGRLSLASDILPFLNAIYIIDQFARGD